MSADTYDLTAERVLGAAVEAVFDAYTDPESGRRVFAGGPDWVVEVRCDLNVGGVWSITSAPPSGAAYRETNHFTLIDRPRRLTFESALTMPDGSNLERDVEVTFKSEDGGRTPMTILQQGFPNAEVRDAFGAGFPRIFDRLERLAKAWPARGESGPRGAPAKSEGSRHERTVSVSEARVQTTRTTASQTGCQNEPSADVTEPITRGRQ